MSLSSHPTEPPTSTELIVAVEALTKVYATREAGRRRHFTAVDDVSFTVPAGGSLAIVGESGSGKTTVAKMLVGLERVTSGRIEVAGHDRTQPVRRAAARRKRGRDIQIVFQDPYTSLDQRQVVADCVAESLRLHFDLRGTALAERVEELGDMVGLDSRQLRSRPGALSGGQRQRVAIARALAAQPAVLVLDEAVSALDVSIQAQVLNLLADIRARTGVTYLFISHDLAVVRQVTDYAIVMRDGRIVEHGHTADILDRPQHPYTQLLRDCVPRPGWKPTRLRRRALDETA